MVDDELKSHQHSLLATYRQNLRHLLQQAAQYGGDTAAPPYTVNSIQEARENIRRIKSILRGWGEDIQNDPDDETSIDTYTNPIILTILNQNYSASDCIDRIFYQLFRHAKDEVEGRTGIRKSRKNYMRAAVILHLGQLLSQVRYFQSYQYKKFEHSLSEFNLSDKVSSLENILSNQGIYRNYQTDLARYAAQIAHSELEETIRNLDSTVPPFLIHCIDWSKELVRDFTNAWLGYLGEAPNYKYKTIASRGVSMSAFSIITTVNGEIVRQLDPSQLRVRDQSADFVQSLNILYSLLKAISEALEDLNQKK